MSGGRGGASRSGDSCGTAVWRPPNGPGWRRPQRRAPVSPARHPGCTHAPCAAAAAPRRRRCPRSAAGPWLASGCFPGCRPSCRARAELRTYRLTVAHPMARTRQRHAIGRERPRAGRAPFQQALPTARPIAQARRRTRCRGGPARTWRRVTGVVTRSGTRWLGQGGGGGGGTGGCRETCPTLTRPCAFAHDARRQRRACPTPRGARARACGSGRNTASGDVAAGQLPADTRSLQQTQSHVHVSLTYVTLRGAPRMGALTGPPRHLVLQLSAQQRQPPPPRPRPACSARSPPRWRCSRPRW